MHTLISLALFLLPLQARPATFPNSLGKQDFFVAQTKGKAIPQNLAAESCRENIAKAVCLVDPAPENQDLQERKCLEGGQAYGIYFERLYDRYPAALQKMFCSLTHIFIEKEFFGTAYGGLLRDPAGKMNGAIVGIRKSVLDENLDLHRWASWKEQLSFGGNPHSYNFSPELPTIDTASRSEANDFLYFVIAHEFGHIFDFANDLNKTKNCPPPSLGLTEEPECEMAEGSWGSLSWITDKKPKPENEFPLRKSLCFYSCEGKFISQADAPTVYEAMAGSNFISTYATTEPWDDFADSLAYYLAHTNMGTTYHVNTNQGADYDIMQRLESARFAEKYRYIDTFIHRSDITYP